MTASYGATSAPVNPRGYTVPDYGVDQDMINVESSISGAENKLMHTFTANFGATSASVNPRGYTVPDFGVDQDIKDSANSIAITEKKLKQQLSADFGATSAAVNPRGYTVPSYGIDQGIKDVQQSLAWSEKNLGKKLTLLQLDAQSDPICASSGCDQYKQPDGPPVHPMDYPVQDLGQDRDIKDTLANEKTASAIVDHEWKFKTAESALAYRNAAKDVDYNFAPELDGDMKSSLSHLGSAESGQWQWAGN